MRTILAEGESLVTIVDGFDFTEGPVWHPVDGYLVFSDIPANRIYRWQSDVLGVVRDPSNKTNGNAFDLEGRLVSCEHVTSRVVRTELDGTITVLADRFDGAELNSPNDVIVDRAGDVYFTDPVFGRVEAPMGVVRPIPQPVRGVYRWESGGRLTRIIDDFDAPNGLCLSLDERHLFVNDTTFNHIRRFELADGVATGGEVWAVVDGEGPGSADGMKLDSAGNLYCTGPGGVFVFDPSGAPLGVIRVPEAVGNFTWGAEDLRTLYLCASTSVYAIRTLVPGLRAFSQA